MSGDEPYANERQSLQTRLLDAVKQCQVRFGGRTELATDSDARVSCLCSAWETVLLHGLRGNPKAISALLQVTEITGLNKVTGIFTEKTAEKDTAFWGYVKEILTKHEAERFQNLKNIQTDSGRGRSWLRASLNEHSLERYMHMLVESDALLSRYYESWAFLRDQEKSSMLPMMARGLDSILFAIVVDNAELNAVRTVPATNVMLGQMTSSPQKPDSELRPVIAGETEPGEIIGKKKDKKKKKKVSHIVSFDEDESGSGTFSKLRQSGRSDSFTYGSPSELSTISPVTDSVLNSTYKTSADTTDSDQKNTESSVGNTEQFGVPVPSSKAADTTYMMKREPSIASGRSDSRRSQGSFSSADFELSMELSGTVMTPITPSGEPAIDDEADDSPFGQSCESSGMMTYNGDDIHAATFALQQAQLSFKESHRTDGDGGNVSEHIKGDRMSTEELKKAVVTMMLRKDEVEEQNKSLQAMLEQEMETSSVLRAEIEEVKHSAAVKQEKEQAKIQAMQKENDLLKHQLRKYVNAVQMLRTEGSNVDANLGIHIEDPQPAIPPERPKTDYSLEAEEYEKKLIQVAEMHGELMEFNEVLHRQLNMREHMLRRLQNELVDLRGPLPHDINFTDDPMSLGTEQFATMQTSTLINVWIPSAFLRGSGADSHHVYQIYVRIKDEEWNIYKRYKQFNDLHKAMKKSYPLSAKFDFPQKKTFGKKDAKVVEIRRHILQTYLRALINHILEKNPSLSNNVCKQTMLEFIPFFSDKVSEKEKKQKKKKITDGQSTPLSSSPRQPTPVPEQYGGL